MRARFAPVFALLVVIGCVASACGGLVDPSKNQLETINGTLQPGTFDTYPYTISKSGEYTITLVSLTPALPLGGSVGVAFGLSASGGGCQQISTNPAAVAGRQVLGTSITPGNYCIVIADTNGFVRTPTAYVMQFSHP
jgi:hypothetical protein